jgi:hypothetical protein
VASQQRALLAENGPLARSIGRMAVLMRSSGRLSGGVPMPVVSRTFLEPS